ncbi:MAG: ChaN family lipoprotein, partial [Halopseudomonas sp.]
MHWLLVTVMLGILAPGLGAQTLPQWISPLGHDAAHVGQILDTASGEWHSPQQLLPRLADAAHLVVGEQHDNPDHHALQLWLLEHMARRREQATVVLEMLDADQQAAVQALQQQPLPDDPALIARLRWSEGWDWATYGPIVRWALSNAGALRAANLSDTQIRAVYQQPPALSDVYAKQAREALYELIAQSHCDRLPQERYPAMLAVQQSRDQRMAQVLAAAPEPALILVGSVHARKDLGLALHWPAQRLEPPVTLIMVEAGKPLP